MSAQLTVSEHIRMMMMIIAPTRHASCVTQNMHTRNTVAAISLGAGTVLAVATLASSWSHEVYRDVSAVLNPATAGVLSVATAWLFFVAARGYRRLPFLVSAIGGSAVVFATLGMGFAARGPMLLQQTVALAAGYAGLVAAGVFMRMPVLPRRPAVRAVAAVLLCGLAVATVLGAGGGSESAGASGAAGGAGNSGAAGDDSADAAAGDQAQERDTPPRLAYEGEIGELVRRLDPRYFRYREALDPVLEELANDESVTDEQREERIHELNTRIRQLEVEISRFDRVREERERYAQEVERMRVTLREVESRAHIDASDLQRVGSYREAVRPAVPLVRDLAAGLAGEHPGSYYAGSRAPYPGETGLQQVLAIHRYVMGRWRYVNDPLYIRSNYHSPADRTIAAGFVGDCDDFASLIASMVEAVGGTVRILHGTCAGGAHAWAEVLLGDAQARARLEPVLQRAFPGRRMQFLQADARGNYWLSLDWEVGRYSCGGNPVLQYISGGSRI
ncbi:MAG: hypothetical protein EA383_17230 [Spirochaetaceae bacterium]|nr:MAG: hypothetical protein EA383_17230 [Spirochaetaceae bacterium]